MFMDVALGAPAFSSPCSDGSWVLVAVLVSNTAAFWVVPLAFQLPLWEHLAAIALLVGRSVASNTAACQSCESPTSSLGLLFCLN